MNGNWVKKISEICEYYKIPAEYLPEIIIDPKVIPMIRGKGFEFSVIEELKKILPKSEWEIKKLFINPQIGSHDADVQLIHKQTGKNIRIECKLADKESFRQKKIKKTQERKITLQVKCMRSRTLGDKKTEEQAPKKGVTKQALSAHQDSYLPSDFDVVITSIANAFFRTNGATGRFVWQPTEEEKNFLRLLGCPEQVNPKDFAFSQVYLAKSSDLAVLERNKITCRRRKCQDKANCGFIPNYPILEFNPKTGESLKPWFPLQDAPRLLKSMVIG